MAIKGSSAGSRTPWAEGGPWLEAAVEVAAIDAELVAEVFRQSCPGGVAIEYAVKPLADGEGYSIDGDAAAVVKAYLPAGAQAQQSLRSLKLALRFTPLARPGRWRRARRLRDEDWRDAWKRHFSPTRLGRRLVVKPTWAGYARRRLDIVVEIDPGLAFGSGQHPTTRMCLRALEEAMRPGLRVLDLGTGSGILAIAAAKLGAGQVLALDIDPQAVKAAGENAQANGVQGIVRVEEGILDEARAKGAAYDVILANISGQTIEALVPLLALALAPGGRLISSGFLEEAVAALSRRLAHCSLVVEQVLAEGEWRALLARHGEEGAQVLRPA